MDKLSEFEAANLVKMSPRLLRWFTSYAPKKDKIKLKTEIKNGLYYYNKKDLLDFDLHLRKPWSKPIDGQRPSVPEGINDEIKKEAHFECPVCHRTTCEVAHIKPVSKTFNNHPHNLIFLCANHHTEYDFGFKYKGLTESDVIKFKEGLQTFQYIQWNLQSETINSYLKLISIIGTIKELEKTITNFTGTEFDELFKLILSKIDILKTKKIEGEKIETLIDSININDSSSTKNKAYSFLTVKDEIQNEFKENVNLKECPLCHANGFTDDYDICPVCNGESYVAKSLNIDIEIYEKVECPLCEGQGHTSEFEECPVCLANGKVTKDIFENVDIDDYKKVECPLCEGQGSNSEYNECPLCNGDGKVTQHVNNDVDLDEFKKVECPLCKGDSSTSEYDECPLCKGDGKVTPQVSENFDKDDYNKVECPLCEGQGSNSEYNECPLCDATGKVTPQVSENFDKDDYNKVECPLCEGQGYTSNNDDCPLCEGECKVTPRVNDNFDPSDYKK